MLKQIKPVVPDRPPLKIDPLAAEVNFYSAYDWSLDPHLTVSEAIERFAGEIDRLASAADGWQTNEVTTNVYLLSCSLLNGIDEYLRGRTLRLPVQLARTRPGRIAFWATEKIGEVLPKLNKTQIYRWKEEWQNGLDDFFAVFAGFESNSVSFVKSAQKLAGMLHSPPFPSDLLDLRLGVPSAFSRLDLTHFDVLALGRQFARQYHDRSHPILLLGLRTAGTYFSTLLRSYFKAEGYRQVASLTVQPKKGPSRRENAELARYAKRGFTLVIVDDPPHTGGTIAIAVEIARRAGFDLSRIKALVPTHPTARNWANTLPDDLVITLEPQRWRKRQLLDPKNIESRLTEYFTQQGVSNVHVIGSRDADGLEAGQQNGSNRKRGATLKQIFEVQLRTPLGNDTRHILAESVGLGYLGYPAFVAAHRLSDFVPQLIGLRDGILYTEWLPQQPGTRNILSDRDTWIDTAASYVATRTRLLRLPKGRAPGKAEHENGLELLAESFGRAYGPFLVDVLMRPRLQQLLCRLSCPLPTLIDGNMGYAEWINGRSGPLKTNYHQHALGKTQLNVVDPAFDLAEIILSFALSREEEDLLIHRYVEYSRDVDVGQRLLINKLLAGLWTMKCVQEQLFGTMQTGQRQQELYRRFLGAWDFLSIQTARFCGARCRPPEPTGWRPLLVMLDIDGVLDRRVFGYPCTTDAGVKALSLLSSGRFSVALNTARSAAEVKDYCDAYGLAGGVAENGAYLWDAVTGCGQSLLDQETMVQFDKLRKQLRRTPGVFLDERHRYSIRAFTFEKQPHSLLSRLLNSIRSFSIGQGIPTPLPTLVLDHLIADLGLDRLSFHHTLIDTAIVAKDIDKGTGLKALRDRVLSPDAETIAIGDTEADLPMFRAATRSFAPAQISCRRQARLLGCVISSYRYQRGLLDIARTLVGSGPSGGPIEIANESDGETLVLDLLQAADWPNARALVRAFFNRTIFRIFVQ